MKKAVILILCILLSGAVACGCGTQKEEQTEEETMTAPDEALYGTWSEDYFDSGYVFNSDGTGEDIFWELPFTYTTEDGGNLILTFDDELWGVAEYTYSVSGDQLDLTQKDSSDTYTYTKQ